MPGCPDRLDDNLNIASRQWRAEHDHRHRVIAGIAGLTRVLGYFDHRSSGSWEGASSVHVCVARPRRADLDLEGGGALITAAVATCLDGDAEYGVRLAGVHD